MENNKERGMNIPDDLKYHEKHQWLKIIDDITIICGLTDYIQDTIGEINLVEFINNISNSEIETGEKIAIIESIKDSVDIKSIVSGRVIEINRDLEETPELVNSDPYGDGWIYKIEINDAAMLNGILDPDEYLDIIFTEDLF